LTAHARFASSTQIPLARELALVAEPVPVPGLGQVPGQGQVPGRRNPPLTV